MHAILKSLLLASVLFASPAWALDFFTVQSGVLREGFEDHTSWTFAGTGSKSDNTDAAYIMQGSKSLHIQGQTSGAAVVHKPFLNQDFSVGTMVGLWFYDAGAAGTLNKIQLHFATDASVANRFSYIWDATNTGLVRGWNFLAVNRDAFTKTGTISWSDVDHLRIQVDSTGIGGANIYLDNLVSGFYTRPKLLIFFDDGHDSTYTVGYTEMAARGLKGTYAVQCNLIDGANAISTAQYQTAYDAGWSLVNHTVTHKNLVDATPAEIRTELSGCRETLRSKGWTRNLDLLVAPQGAIDNEAEDVMRELGFRYARGGRSMFTNSQQSSYGGVDAPYRLISQDIEYSGVSLAQAKAMLDNAVRLGSSVMLFFHKFGAVADSLTWTTSDYQEWLAYADKYVKSNVMDNLTYDDYVRELDGKRPVTYQ